MRQLVNHIFCTAIFFACSVSLHAQTLPQLPSTVAPNTATTTPLRIQLLGNMEFGMFALDSQGAVKVDAKSGACVAVGRVAQLNNICRQAEYEIVGRASAQVQLMLPQEAPLSGTNLVLKDFRAYPEGIITLGPDGRAKFSVGATLHASKSSSKGDYIGMFLIDAYYLD